ncbi:MAG: hypothetical protein PVI00_09650 [Desulfobacterales bacterium]|jgi:hypothetical protein
MNEKPLAGQTLVIWTELLQKTPFAHTAPLPPQNRTVLDGSKLAKAAWLRLI